jgi:hypothetical protein
MPVNESSQPQVSYLVTHAFLVCRKSYIPRPVVQDNRRKICDPFFCKQRDTKKDEQLLVFYQLFRPSADGVTPKENGHDASSTASTNSKSNNSRMQQAVTETRSSKPEAPQVKEIPIETKSTTKPRHEEQKQKSSNKQQGEQKKKISNNQQEEPKQNNEVEFKPPAPPMPPPPPMPELSTYRTTTIKITFNSSKSYQNSNQSSRFLGFA